MLKKYENLLSAAGEAREKAYAPYSGFRVGAALLSEDGQIFSGCNVENASYPVCLCAERNALGQAVASGHRVFTAIAVYAGENRVPPCGLCRQALSEFGDMDVLFPDGEGGTEQIKLSELLPQAFQADRRKP